MGRAIETRVQNYFGAYESGMSLGDLHNHTDATDGLMHFRQVIDQAEELGLTAIAITDHDTVRSAMEAREYAAKQGYGLQVYVGAEISMSRRRHIVALGIEHDIASGKSPEWTIRKIHNEGGIALVPHPLSPLVPSLGKRVLLAIAYHVDSAVHPDAFELLNGGTARTPIGQHLNNQAKNFYLQHKTGLGAAVGSTDGHHNGVVGEVLTGFRGDLFKAINGKETVVLFLDERVPITSGDLARQFYRSMVREPAKRLLRGGK